MLSMVALTLTCEKPDCPFKIRVESVNPESAKALYNYGTINPKRGSAFELNCLLCGSPMESLSTLKVKIKN